MVPSLRRSVAHSTFASSAFVTSTFVSHVGIHSDDRSFLLVRERIGTLSDGERLALHGAFDASVCERLHQTLRESSQSSLPLVLDLRGICALDEGFLLCFLKMQREVALIRTVSFQIAADGPVLPLIQRLGLEERFGLETVKRQPLKRSAAAVPVFAVPRADADKIVSHEFAAS